MRQAWLSDPAQDVRARAATTLGILGDSESVETFIAAFRNRATAAKEAKGALAALAALGDVRAVPDILQALIDNWGGPLPAEALLGIGVPALESIMTLVTSRPDLAQRKSLQDFVLKMSSSSQAGRLLCKRMGETLDASDGVERAAALLKLSSESEPLRQTLARQILARITVPSSKAEKALARAAQQALEKEPRTARA